MGKWVSPSISRKRSEANVEANGEEDEMSLKSCSSAKVRFLLEDRIHFVQPCSKSELCGDTEAAYKADTIADIVCALRGADPDYGLLAHKRHERLSTFAARSWARKFIHALADLRAEKEDDLALAVAVEDSLKGDVTSNLREESRNSASCSSAEDEPERRERLVSEPCVNAPCPLGSPRRSMHEERESLETDGFQKEQKEQIGAFFAYFDPSQWCGASAFCSVASRAQHCWMSGPQSAILWRTTAS